MRQFDPSPHILTRPKLDEVTITPRSVAVSIHVKTLAKHNTFVFGIEVEVAETKGMLADGRHILPEGDGAGAVVGDGDFDVDGMSTDLLHGHEDILHGLVDFGGEVPHVLTADAGIGALPGGGDEFKGQVFLFGERGDVLGVNNAVIIFIMFMDENFIPVLKTADSLCCVEGSLASGKRGNRCTGDDRGGERWCRGGGSNRANKAKDQDMLAEEMHLG